MMEHHRFLVFWICFAVVWNDFCSVTCLNQVEEKYVNSFVSLRLDWFHESKRLTLVGKVIPRLLDGCNFFYFDDFGHGVLDAMFSMLGLLDELQHLPPKMRKSYKKYTLKLLPIIRHFTSEASKDADKFSDRLSFLYGFYYTLQRSFCFYPDMVFSSSESVKKCRGYAYAFDNLGNVLELVKTCINQHEEEPLSQDEEDTFNAKLNNKKELYAHGREVLAKRLADVDFSEYDPELKVKPASETGSASEHTTASAPSSKSSGVSVLQRLRAFLGRSLPHRFINRV